MNRRRFLQHSAAVAMLPRNALTRLPMFDDDTSERFWQNVRKQFPLRDDRIYFNTGGLGPSPLPVLNTLVEKTRQHDESGETGHEIFERARERVAAFVGAHAEEIAFTRNATEGMNIIARGIPLQLGDEVITTFHEHPGGAIPWLTAVRDVGARIKLIELPANPAELVEHVEQSIGSKTRVFMMSHVPCTTGTIYPAAELCASLRERKVISVLDGAQAIGMTRVRLHEIGCDFYSTSGHKWLLGPKETGLVYTAKSAQEFFRPSFVGAYSDTRYDLDELILELRQTAQVSEYGTRNAATIHGLMAAMDFLEAIGWQKNYDRQRELASRLIMGLKGLPRVDFLTSTTEGEFGGIVTFRIKDFSISDLTAKLMKDFHIRVRTISEHKLNACRISLHVFNSPQEVDKLIGAVEEIVS
jgi:selenocysteine lyase/cysteine desulfurase